jgi:hydroxymethylpyrimidine pyrophosphatase-like HAD family hydrolase
MPNLSPSDRWLIGLDIDGTLVHDDGYLSPEVVKEVQRVKQLGLAAEISNSSAEMKTYLEELRRLSKQNDFFVRSVQTNYDKALKYQQSELFLGVVNSGLMDISAKKQEILDYYYEHELTLTPSGRLEELVNEDKILKQRRDSSHARNKTKKMIEDKKIKRIRENDLQAQKELEAKLQEEVNKKKLKIRETQKEALSL